MMDKNDIKQYKQDLSERFFGLNFDNKAHNLKFIVDRETGVEYLAMGGGFSPVLTPLVDVDGRPKINQLWKEGKLS
ncbi:DUF6440 family protein [Streptococcus saliviloxodontae]|uniref:DUF6440 domain-containing protein n=1 Tax=Streptococcus saliviloxodontae TaxID=1349416 RepID=A0ABS2PMZ3_9STRE|nr:DUF6440 family protein [Streptococcus saliviloxodontae]MBM7636178.1 hypothetical protein [Streptococcus saliviloxodontae]